MLVASKKRKDRNPRFPEAAVTLLQDDSDLTMNIYVADNRPAGLVADALCALI